MTLWPHDLAAGRWLIHHGGYVGVKSTLNIEEAFLGKAKRNKLK
jgi:hypothetical protein